MRISVAFIFLLFFKISKGIEVPGIIILNNNDTLRVKIDLPVDIDGYIKYKKIQNLIKYTSADNKQKKLNADEAKEISFNYKLFSIKLLSRPKYMLYLTNTQVNLENGRNIFLRVVLEGKMKIFEYHYIETRVQNTVSNGSLGSSGEFVEVKAYLLQKGDGNLFKPTEFSFDQEMANYVSDCPTVSNEIRRGHYNLNIDMIATDYNSKCPESDTLFTSKKEKITCSIIEISEDQVIFVTNGNTNKVEIKLVEKAVFKNGYSEKFGKKP